MKLHADPYNTHGKYDQSTFVFFYFLFILLEILSVHCYVFDEGKTKDDGQFM